MSLSVMNSGHYQYDRNPTLVLFFVLFQSGSFLPRCLSVQHLLIHSTISPPIHSYTQYIWPMIRLVCRRTPAPPPKGWGLCLQYPECHTPGHSRSCTGTVQGAHLPNRSPEGEREVCANMFTAEMKSKIHFGVMTYFSHLVVPLLQIVCG